MSDIIKNEEAMTYSTLGRTGFEVSRLSYGGTGVGDMYSKTEQDQCNECIDLVLEKGINYFDTSPSYGPRGLSETRMGIALARDNKRKGVVLTTKCGRFDEGEVDAANFVFDYSAKRVRKEIENSLTRLKTDYIDIYQIHEVRQAPSLTMLIEETLPEMDKLRQEGKCRYIGITDCQLNMLKYVAERSPYVDMLLTFLRYNLIDQTLDGYFDDLKKERNIGIVNSSVMYIGMLARGIHTLAHHRAEDKHVELKAACKKASDLCDEYGVDIGELADRFGCDCGYADSTLVAMGKPARFLQNYDLFRKPITEADKELIGKVTEILKGFDMFPDKTLKL